MSFWLTTEMKQQHNGPTEEGTESNCAAEARHVHCLFFSPEPIEAQASGPGRALLQTRVENNLCDTVLQS